MKKTVLVTGGTIRLGKCIADYLRETGWEVFTTSHRPDAGADFCYDFSDRYAAEKLAEALAERLGERHLDALVNNAAFYDLRLIGEMRPAEAQKRLEEIWNINCLTPELLAECVIKAGADSIVNILDAQLLDEEALSRGDLYATTKCMMKKFTYRMAKNMAPQARVNAVAPGSVLPPVGRHEKAAGRLLTNPPTGKDVAKAVAFLLDNDSITGVVLPVDGGLVDRVSLEVDDDEDA